MFHSSLLKTPYFHSMPWSSMTFAIIHEKKAWL